MKDLCTLGGTEGQPISGSFCDNAACVLDACLHLSLLITCSLRKGFQDTLVRGSISYTSEEKKQPLSQTLKPLSS